MSDLDAPCKWCGYNGPGYWQKGTHTEACPWHKVGGSEDRRILLDLHDTDCDPGVASEALKKLSKFARKATFSRIV
jgi:hypothetical protein